MRVKTPSPYITRYTYPHPHPQPQVEPFQEKLSLYRLGGRLVWHALAGSDQSASGRPRVTGQPILVGHRMSITSHLQLIFRVRSLGYDEPLVWNSFLFTIFVQRWRLHVTFTLQAFDMLSGTGIYILYSPSKEEYKATSCNSKLFPSLLRNQKPSLSSL
ncbi:hypothetical protein BGW80DRAFT_623536 [Lactifluus volemus]|nr:hypothetical protein BGW80DRAFT_623536 [Lactifluus volemus]